MSANKHFLDIDKRSSGFPKLAVIVVVFLITLMSLMVVHSWSRSKNVVSPIEVLLGTPRGPSAELTIVSRDDITVYMPPDATNLAGTLSVSLAEPDPSLIADNSGWLRPQIVNIQFQRSDGTPVSDISFAEPLEVCFNLNEEQWDAFLAQADSYQVQHYAAKNDPPGWEILPQVTYPDRRQVCGQTSHLSLFSLAVKPEVPVTGPTATLTITPAPTSTPIQPVQTQERRRKDNPTSSAPQPAPTNQPPTSAPTSAPTNASTSVPTNAPTSVPTSAPPTATQQQPTPIPPTPIPPTPIPPTPEPPTQEPPPPTEPPVQPTEPPAATGEPVSAIGSTLADLLDQWISP